MFVVCVNKYLSLMLVVMNTETVTQNKYKHLSFEQRAQIKALHDQWFTQTYIATYIWCSQPSISRELSRNSIEYTSWRTIYKPDKAQSFYKDRRTKANLQHRLLRKHKELYNIIDKLLSQWHTPDIIANRIIKEETIYSISTPTIYNYIQTNPLRRKQCTFKYWYKKHWTTKKQWKICPNLPRISQRPQEINDRLWDNDREVDSIVSIGHKWWATTLTNRKTRYLLIQPASKLTAEITYNNIISMSNQEVIESITADNWSEFAKLEQLAFNLKISCYLCDPYCSWQKWSNERNNREIRKYIPKWSDINTYNKQKIQEVQDTINRKPRKILGYLSAYELQHWVRLTYLN